MLKKDSMTFMQPLKFLIQKKDTIIVLIFFNTGKGLHHLPMTLEGFNFEKWLHHILMTVKNFLNSYFVESWWTVAAEGCLA